MTRRLRSAPLSAQRDGAVDVIKGTACALMIVAHVPFSQAPWLERATMAAVLFFASTGMNLQGILQRRPEDAKRLAANALFLIFGGLADNYVQGTLGDCDVFQIAGLAMLAMLFLRHLLPRCWTWLFPLPFLLHAANQHFHWKIAVGGLSSYVLTPGLFPLVPWLSFYILGAHLVKSKSGKRGWLTGAAAALLLISLLFVRPFEFRKFWMSADYFLIGCGVVSFSLAALRQWLSPRAKTILTEIRLWGANSLVFYIVNNFTVKALEMAGLRGATVFLLAVLITALLLRPALALQRWTSVLPPATVLLVSVLTAAAAVTATAALWQVSFYLRTLSTFGVTLSFVAAYPAWKNLSRNLFSPDAADFGVRELALAFVREPARGE
jgi:hypothetical protein